MEVIIDTDRQLKRGTLHQRAAAITQFKGSLSLFDVPLPPLFSLSSSPADHPSLMSLYQPACRAQRSHLPSIYLTAAATTHSHTATQMHSNCYSTGTHHHMAWVCV